jgi:hypothetical protein
VLDLNTDDRVFFIVQNRETTADITVEFMKFVVTSITAEKGPQGNTGPAPVIALNEIAFGDGSGIISSPLFQVVTSTGTNTITNTSFRSSIIGGYINELDSFQSSIIAGYRNKLYCNSCNSIIIGGSNNKLYYDGVDSSIIGGDGNCVYNSTRSAIIGGQNNNFDAVYNGGVFGGYLNALSQTTNSSIIGGNRNLISQSTDSSIIGGNTNKVESQGDNSVIIGGYGNKLYDKACFSSIISSYQSVICRSSCSVIIGGIGLTLSSEDGVVYVPTLKIATASNFNADRILVWDTDNYVKYRDSSTLGGSTTGTASINFEDLLYGALEVPEGRVLVTDANVLLTSTINIIVGTSSDHDSIEDAVYEDLNFKYEITTPGEFTIYGYAPLDTHGIWNLIYRVIN